MARADLGATGAVISPTEGPELTETAVALEALGFPTIWLTGGPLTSLDQVAAVVRATEHVTVATGILAVVRWSSDDVGALYDELEASHPGRFVVGLGGAHGPQPIPTLEAYLDRLDARARRTPSPGRARPSHVPPGRRACRWRLPGGGHPRAHRRGPRPARPRHHPGRRPAPDPRARPRAGPRDRSRAPEVPGLHARLPGQLPAHGLHRRRHRHPQRRPGRRARAVRSGRDAGGAACRPNATPAPTMWPSTCSRRRTRPPLDEWQALAQVVL